MFNKKEKLQDKGKLQEPVISSHKQGRHKVVTLDFGVPVKKLEYQLITDQKAIYQHPRRVTQGHWCEAIQSEHRVPGYGFVAIAEIPLSLRRELETESHGCTYILNYHAHGFAGDTLTGRMTLDVKSLNNQRKRRQIIQASHFIDGWVYLRYPYEKNGQESTIDFSPLLDFPVPTDVTKVEYQLYHQDELPNQSDELITLVKGSDWHNGGYARRDQIKITGYADQIGIKVHFTNGDPIWRVFDLRSQRYDIEKQLGESFPHEKAAS